MNPSSAIFKTTILLTIILVCFSCSSNRGGKPKILVFSKTAGFHHESIADGNAAILKLGSLNNFDVDTTTNANMFQEDTLKKYAAIVFLSATGNLLNYFQEAAFERYIQAGGGYMGIHAATDAEYDWGWYGRLTGAYFLDHPGINDSFPNVQEAILNVVDTNNNAIKGLPKQWKRTDEYYNFKKISKDIKVLMTIDEKTYHGGKNGENHPMTWYHEFDGGRAFYTELGHTKESYTDSLYLKLILGGIEYAIGNNDQLNYSKATTQIPPDENRLSKTQLVTGEFFEPTEMTIMPNLDILVLQRRGEIMLYKQATQKVTQVGFLKVYFKASVPNVNAEEGMLGLAKDPDFASNNWVYIYYSPADSAVNRLSRFTFKNDSIENASEKIILQVKSQREICCHTGGSIAFGPDKLLYFSSGDNSTPFDEPGQKYVSNSYAPLNDNPGHEQYDARRSAGNTNDLRGKIMRIKVKDDGSYDIPDGNLFAKGTPKTRAEIYIMGDRNPYRITVDQKNSYLYWGEVGPDANDDSLASRGPRGYDEINQARKAGFFGWPYFVGNNYAYHTYNYNNGTHGPAFDPAHPVNDSRNNTGLRELPPAQPAFIWYPYAASPDFPQVGTGGRNAMAGPVYYTDLFPKETRMPDYYNGKLIIYDWIRGWMKLVTMQPNGDFDKMEPFLPSAKLNSLIDMEVGPDGKLYLLEYGTGWFSKNADAGLARIDFNSGNRAPIISSIKVDKTSGVLPLAVKVTVVASDPENDKITYVWNFGNGTSKETATPEISYTYTTLGDYKISVETKDNSGASSKSADVSIYAGNEIPTVAINLYGGNKSFYLPGMPLKYSVNASDKTDTAKIDPANFFVAVDYVEGYDKAANVGHQQGQASIAGKSLIMTLDCKSCHKEAEKSIGPSFTQVSEKYLKDPNAKTYLAQKIMKGGSGVWGDVAMAAHPNIDKNDLQQIITWVLSLANKATVKKSLSPDGTIIVPAMVKPNTTLVLFASYTDKGGNNIKALTGTNTISLASNSMSFSGKESAKGFTFAKYSGINLWLFPVKEGWFALNKIDLTDVNEISVTAVWMDVPKAAIDLELHLDAVDGKLLGKGTLQGAKDSKSGIIKILVETVKDGEFHKLFFTYKGQQIILGGLKEIQFNYK